MLIAATSVLEKIIESPVILVLICAVIGIVMIVFQTLKAIMLGRAREQTKREIAAYVAEGTIDADKAVEMLKAGNDKDAD
jgi:hypothetical protein